jgi:hypothetical protein
MKKIPFIFLICLSYVACNQKDNSNTGTVPQDSASAAGAGLPYKAMYSSRFVPGKQSDLINVLDSYKYWEGNNMKSMRNTFGDSVEFHHFSGFIFKNTGDSFVRHTAKVRDSLSKVEITMYAWMANHSVDQNEDWVNVWYEETDTYKSGLVDSAGYEDDNRLKDGKIVYVASHMLKLKQ